jgi:protein ImuA
MAAGSSSLSIEDFGAAVWRADALACAAGATLASGHAALDAELPGGGWPLGAISEILQVQSGLDEWRLLLPALIRLTRTTTGCVGLVGTPHSPFGPGLSVQGFDPRRLLWVRADAPAARLWAAEQALRCADVSALLVWLPQVRPESLRRLQVSAHQHSKFLFVMRPEVAQSESSPAALRLLISSQVAIAGSVQMALTGASADALQVHILKRRGPPLARTLSLSARPARLAVLLALNGCLDKGDGDALDCIATLA